MGYLRTCCQSTEIFRDHQVELQVRVVSYVSADEIVPVLNDSPGCDPDSANFL